MLWDRKNKQKEVRKHSLKLEKCKKHNLGSQTFQICHSYRGHIFGKLCSLQLWRTNNLVANPITPMNIISSCTVEPHLTLLTRLPSYYKQNTNKISFLGSTRQSHFN